MTLQDALLKAMKLLEPVLGKEEARWTLRIVMETLKNWNQADVVLRKDEELTPHLEKEIERISILIAQGNPLQYVLGTTQWHSLNLMVNPSVLIPRPETAQLVDFIIEEYKDCKDLKILDIGTGSGAIALALARHLPFPQITAIEISEEALETARQNAAALKVNVNFLLADIFTLAVPEEPYDIIVSNPPYVLEKEKAEMSPSVLEHEPHLALFVPDSDPLKFYKPIINFASRATKPGGKLFLEINPLYAIPLTLLLSPHFTDVEVLTDFNKHKRFVIATKN